MMLGQGGFKLGGGGLGTGLNLGASVGQPQLGTGNVAR